MHAHIHVCRSTALTYVRARMHTHKHTFTHTETGEEEGVELTRFPDRDSDLNLSLPPTHSDILIIWSVHLRKIKQDTVSPERRKRKKKKKSTFSIVFM